MTTEKLQGRIQKNKKVVQHLKDRSAEALDVSIVPGTFRIGANLFGAVLNFLQPDQN